MNKSIENLTKEIIKDYSGTNINEANEYVSKKILESKFNQTCLKTFIGANISTYLFSTDNIEYGSIVGLYTLLSLSKGMFDIFSEKTSIKINQSTQKELVNRLYQ